MDHGRGVAVAAALLVVLAATLVLLSAASFRRYRAQPFVVLTGAFALVLVEGIGISLVAIGVIAREGFPLLVIAALQVAALVLIYAATFSRR